MQKFIEKEIIKKGYVQRARTNALNNLAQLCHALKVDVKVTDRQGETNCISELEFENIPIKVDLK